MTLDKINPTKTKSWKKLKSLKSTVDLKTLFKNDNDRLKKYSISIDELYVDYSKNLIPLHYYRLIYFVFLKYRSLEEYC